AIGAFTYNGVTIPLSQDTIIKCNSKQFDFALFKEYSIKTDVSSDKLPQDVTLINTYIFDQLLHQKTVKKGVYTETPGLLSEAVERKQPLKLFITSALSESQWYCLFHQAHHHKVPLELYVAANVEIPKNLPKKAIAVDA